MQLAPFCARFESNLWDNENQLLLMAPELPKSTFTQRARVESRILPTLPYSSIQRPRRECLLAHLVAGHGLKQRNSEVSPEQQVGARQRDMRIRKTTEEGAL